MDHLRKLIVAITAFLVAPFAFAGYAQLAAPTNFAVRGADLMMTTAANTGTFAGGFFGAGGVANVGGKAVVMPAAYRLAANAASVAVTAVRLNPTALVTSAVAAWLIGYGLEWANDQWLKKGGDGQPYVGTLSRNGNYYTNYQYSFNGSPVGPFATAEAACRDWFGRLGKTFFGVVEAQGAGTEGSFYCQEPSPFTPGAGQTLTTQPMLPSGPVNVEAPGSPAVESDWDAVKAAPLPESVAVALPSVPLPVEVPILNPSPDLQPQPLRVPNGEPQPVPDTNPQEWRQPATKLTPANNKANPFQVDVTGEDVKLTDPTQKLSSPTPVTTSSPPAESKPDDFCQKNAGSLACSRLGGPLEALPIPNVDKAMTITPESGFGPSNGTCPAPRQLTVQGHQISWDWSIYCQFASGIRPLFIAFGWFVALGSFFGFARKD